jgi:hypothetical protein
MVFIFKNNEFDWDEEVSFLFVNPVVILFTEDWQPAFQ